MTVSYISPKLKAPVRAAFRRHCHGFLAIGYVQTDTLEYWNCDLQKRVKDEAQQLKLVSSVDNSNFESAFPLEWSSTHRRDDKPPIELFHMLLDCRKAAAQ
jgi:hypothetical protein